MVQELTAYKTSIVDGPNILPPLVIDGSSVASCANASQNDHNLLPGSMIERGRKHQEKEESNMEDKSLIVEPWIHINTRDAPLSKTIRKLLRVASDSYEDDSECLSDCSSLTFSDETTVACSNECKSNLNNDGFITAKGIDEISHCNSEDSTVACGNQSKEICNEGHGWIFA